MLTHPMVSICIPLYNAEKFIAETIRKIQHQTYPNIEVVIVDDHSTDGSFSIAKEFESERVRIFKNLKKGGNSARNYAFEMSKGEYIKFLDADDYCSDNMIMAQVERLIDEGSDETLIFSPVRMLFPNGEILDPPRSLDYDHTPGIELLLDIWRGKGWNCPHCHLMHRSLVEKVGGWDETILKNQDGEFFARIAAAADKALSVPSEIAYWYQTGVGVSVVMSVDAHRSVIRSFDIISDLLLDYKDTSEVRAICASEIGVFVYRYYPSIKLAMPEVYKLLTKLNQPFRLPQRRVLKLLSFFLGWKLALRVINRFKL